MKVMFVGDTHGNTLWWEKTVAKTVVEHQVDLVIQLGDFGWWEKRYPNKLSPFLTAVENTAVPVWFLDGNHENHPKLNRAVNRFRRQHNITDLRAKVPLTDNVSFLPRGARFSIGETTFLAIGGAASIDRAFRTPGKDWFLEETLNDEEIQLAASSGPVDVVLSHDTIAGYVIPGLAPRSQLPRAWLNELETCEAHRQKLLEAVTPTTPKFLLHGHYHSFYQKPVDTSWGELQIIGVSTDGTRGSLLVADLNASSFDPQVVI